MVYLLLFWEFFKIGLFTFGGGYAMIPLVQDAIMRHGWLSEAQFMDLIGVCESTPGPIAINMATYIGSTQGGILGAFLATLGVVLPSFIIILLIASVLNKLTENKYVQRALTGIKGIVLGLILSTGIIFTLKVFGYHQLEPFVFDLKSTIIFGVLLSIGITYKLITKKSFNSILMIVISAVLGVVVCLLIP